MAAHAGTIMGVESNGMQFYPQTSLPEAAIHPGLYRRSQGLLDLSTINGRDSATAWPRSPAPCPNPT